MVREKILKSRIYSSKTRILFEETPIKIFKDIPLPDNSRILIIISLNTASTTHRKYLRHHSTSHLRHIRHVFVQHSSIIPKGAFSTFFLEYFLIEPVSYLETSSNHASNHRVRGIFEVFLCTFEPYSRPSAKGAFWTCLPNVRRDIREQK